VVRIAVAIHSAPEIPIATGTTMTARAKLVMSARMPIMGGEMASPNK